MASPVTKGFAQEPERPTVAVGRYRICVFGEAECEAIMFRKRVSAPFVTGFRGTPPALCRRSPLCLFSASVLTARHDQNR